MTMSRFVPVFVGIAVLLFIPAREAAALDLSLKAPVCSFTVDHTGEVKCWVGIEFVNRLGIGLAIGHEFVLTPQYSYLIFRNRRAGRDDVFKIPKCGRVEIVAAEDIAISKGQQILTASPDPDRKNSFVIELGEALQQKVNVRLHIDDGAELYRLDLGFLRSYLVVDSEGNVRTAHRLKSDSVWPIDSLEFLAIVRCQANPSKSNLLLCPKHGVNMPFGCIDDVTTENGCVEQFQRVLQRVAGNADGRKFTIAHEIARADFGGFGKPTWILLDNNVILSQIGEKVQLAKLEKVTEIRISKGSSPTRKRVEIVQSIQSGNGTIEAQDVDNDVDLNDFVSAVQRQNSAVTVRDTSRSVVMGWLICFGVPVLGALIAIAVVIYLLFAFVNAMSRALR